MDLAGKMHPLTTFIDFMSIQKKSKKERQSSLQQLSFIHVTNAYRTTTTWSLVLQFRAKECGYATLAKLSFLSMETNLALTLDSPQM